MSHLGWARCLSKRHPLTHTTSPQLLGVPFKSGTAQQLVVPLGARVNSGMDGKSDTIGQRPPPGQPPTQRMAGLGGTGLRAGAAQRRSPRAREPASQQTRKARGRQCEAR